MLYSHNPIRITLFRNGKKRIYVDSTRLALAVCLSILPLPVIGSLSGRHFPLSLGIASDDGSGYNYPGIVAHDNTND